MASELPMPDVPGVDAWILGAQRVPRMDELKNLIPLDVDSINGIRPGTVVVFWCPKCHSSELRKWLDGGNGQFAMPICWKLGCDRQVKSVAVHGDQSWPVAEKEIAPEPEAQVDSSPVRKPARKPARKKGKR